MSRPPPTSTLFPYTTLFRSAARKSGTLKSIRAMVLLDMIGDRSLTIRRDPNSTRWLTDIIWGAAQKLGHRQFMNEEMAIEDDHLPFIRAGVAAVDIIDLDYPQRSEERRVG